MNVSEYYPNIQGCKLIHESIGLSSQHADPKAEQLRELQRMFMRLMSKEAGDIHSNFIYQQFMGEDTVVTADEWAAALPHCFVWCDFW